MSAEQNDQDKPVFPVSNEQFNAAWRNKDNRSVIKGVLHGFRNQLDADDLESAGMEALWKTLQKHDPAHPSGQKFTTSLHRMTLWACLNTLESVERRCDRDDGAVLATTEKLNSYEEKPLDAPLAARDLVESTLSLIPEGYACLLRAYYLDNRPIEAIAAEQLRTVRSVKQSLQTALEACRVASGVSL